MFAVAAIFLMIGLLAVLAGSLDWDSTLGVLDLRAIGEVLGDDNLARWLVGGCGVVLMLIGLQCAF